MIISWAKKNNINYNDISAKIAPKIDEIKSQEKGDASELHNAFRDEQRAKTDRLAKETAELNEDKEAWTKKNEEINEKYSRLDL